ncbi:hypothetical protein [Hymenobacter lucidus]|uniref:Uncharacterized protein n=1 Tax=Hymenobacter lucidus TaxID=2880930 RepID=A0ABS8AZC6_9BACT|nr:hypothetical protein [Hymenobacter lucidus]MCB2411166.1 hypothetical protein [Hymenobacter lucidus]
MRAWVVVQEKEGYFASMKNDPSGCLQIVLISGGVILALLTVIVLGVTYGEPSEEYEQVFNQKLWLSTGQVLRSDKQERVQVSLNNPRERMVSDVMAHHLRVGISRGQVVALLGPPEKEGIEWRVPVGVPRPDSLDDERMSSEAFNRWVDQHAQPDTLMHYRVGEGYFDPISLNIELNGRGQVRKFWEGEG